MKELLLKAVIWLYGHPDAVVNAVKEITAVEQAIKAAKSGK